MASFTVTWTPGAGVYNTDIYLKPKYSGTYQKIASVSGSTSSYVINGLQDNVLYLVKLTSFCTGGTPSDSSPMEFINFTCPQVTLTPACNGVLNYSFPQLGGDVDEYNVILYTSGDVLITTQTKTPAATVTGSFTSLSILTTYKVKVVPKADTKSKTDCAKDSATTLALGPTVLTSPQSIARCDDGPYSVTTLSASFSGSSLTYSWYLNGVLITDGGKYSGATTTSLTITNAGTVPGSYTCKASNSCGDATTTPAIVSLLPDTSVIVHPSIIPTCATDPIVLSVTAGGDSVVYQWQISTNGGNSYSWIPGATSSTYTIAAGTAVEGTKYRVGLYSTCGPETNSNPATVDLIAQPLITSQPTSQVVCAGSNATFTVAYTAEYPTGTIWQQLLGGNWVDIPGATSTTLLTSTVGSYRYRVTNACWNVYSNVVTLSNYTPVSWGTTNSSYTVCTGSSQTITNTYNGSSGTVQWSVSTDGGATFTDIPGATSTSLVLSGITYSQNGYKYKMTVTGPCNTINNVTTLNVYQPVTFPLQPQSQTICTGSSVTFSATVAGYYTSLQWQVSSDGGSTFTNITGATSSSYTFTVTNGVNNYQYRLRASGCGTTSSNAAVLTVSPFLQWGSVSPSTSACPGDSITLTATATVGTLVSQSWQVSTNGGSTWSTIVGETGNTLALTNIQFTQNGYQYRSVAVGTCNTITSPAILLTVNQAVSITSQPVDQSICQGANASFSATVTGTVISYQWQVSTDGGSTWSNVPGATTATLSLTAPDISTSGNKYRLVVTGCGVVTSSVVTLTITANLVITSQPADQTVCTGNSATFSVTATGTGLTYQWQAFNGSSWANISSATSSSVTLSSVTLALLGNSYRVLVTGPCGTVTSSTAQLTINSSSPIWVNRDINTYYVCVGADKYYQQLDTNPCSATYNQTQTGSLYQANSVDCGYTPACNPPTVTTSTLLEPEPGQDPVVTCLEGLKIETIYLHVSSDQYLLPPGYTHPCPSTIGGHGCNRAFSEVKGNNIYIGDSRMNNGGGTGGAVTQSGGLTCNDYGNTPSYLVGGTWTGSSSSRYSFMYVSQAQAQNIALASTNGSNITFSLVPAMLTYGVICDGTNAPHENLTWVRISKNDGTVLYNGCPAGNFTTIDVCTNSL